MKKGIGILLIFAMIIGSYGCGTAVKEEKNSGLTISALQQIFKESDDELVFQKSQAENGYSFQYKKDNSVTKIEYSGEADAEENVTSIKIVNSDVMVNILRDKSELEKTLTKTAEKMTINDLRVGYCFLELTNLLNACGADTSNISVQEIVDFFTNNSTMSVEGWTIKADIENESTVIISAYYSAQ